jgi:hypothetical protein
MTDKEMNKIAELIADKVIKYIDKKQQEFDNQYFNSLDNQFNNISYTYIPEQPKETLEEELAILEIILKIHIDKEDYRMAAMVDKQIKQIKNKLNK